MIPQLPKPKYEFLTLIKWLFTIIFCQLLCATVNKDFDNSILRMELYLQLILWGFFNSLWWFSSFSIVYEEQFSKVVHFLLMLYFQGPVEVAVVFLKDSPENKTQDVRHKNKLRLSFKDFLKKSVTIILLFTGLFLPCVIFALWLKYCRYRIKYYSINLSESSSKHYLYSLAYT